MTLTLFLTFRMQLLKDATKISYGWSLYLAWTGVGFTLASAILFSGAAICLRGEREREEAVNMQYIMPGNFIVLRHVFTLENESKNISFLINTRILLFGFAIISCCISLCSASIKILVLTLFHSFDTY